MKLIIILVCHSRTVFHMARTQTQKKRGQAATKKGVTLAATLRVRTGVQGVWKTGLEALFLVCLSLFVVLARLADVWECPQLYTLEYHVEGDGILKEKTVLQFSNNFDHFTVVPEDFNQFEREQEWRKVLYMIGFPLFLWRDVCTVHTQMDSTKYGPHVRSATCRTFGLHGPSPQKKRFFCEPCLTPKQTNVRSRKIVRSTSLFPTKPRKLALPSWLVISLHPMKSSQTTLHEIKSYPTPKIP